MTHDDEPTTNLGEQRRDLRLARLVARLGERRAELGRVHRARAVAVVRRERRLVQGLAVPS